MLSINNTEKLIGLQGIIVKNIKQSEKTTEIYIQMEFKTHECPCCGTQTKHIHDYRNQTIKDIPAFGKSVLLILKKRRYVCHNCSKRFYEMNTFLPRYHQMTNRLSSYVINKLQEVVSFSSVAREVNLSVSTVIRIFDLIGHASVQLPKVLSIDEFKGNTSGEKYQCIITDPVNKRILDILPTRYAHDLTSYFKKYHRTNTTHFISDMWGTYSNLADTFFNNATYVIDKYHYIRQVFWAFEAVRKEEQKKFNADRRRYFKRSKSLLNKRFKFLSDEQKQEVNIMLYTSEKILSAYLLKEQFFNVLDCKDSDSARTALSKWVMAAQASGLSRFITCSNTMVRWSKGILNSFDCPYTNGFTEGCNNKIKVLKRNAYGYRKFSRFRNRILHIFNNQKQVTNIA